MQPFFFKTFEQIEKNIWRFGDGGKHLAPEKLLMFSCKHDVDASRRRSLLFDSQAGNHHRC